MTEQFWADPELDAAYQRMISLQPVQGEAIALDTPEAMAAFKAESDRKIGAWRAARLEYRTLLHRAGPFPKRAAS